MWGPPVVLWAVIAYRLRANLRSPLGGVPTPEARAHWLLLAFAACGSTILLPPIYAAIAWLTGIRDLAHLLADICMLGAVWSFQLFLFEVGHTGSEVRRGIGYAESVLSASLLCGMVALLVVLFALAQLSGEMLGSPEAGTQTACGPPCDQPTSTFLFAYRLVLLAYLLISSIIITRRCWHDGALSRDPALRLGLRIVALGDLFGFCYLANEGLYLTTRRLALDYPLHDPDALSRVLAALTVLLLMTGSTMPAWGPAAYSWAWSYWAHRRLYVLWEDLRRANPGIALFPVPSRLGDVLRVRDLDLRLRRRVVEIRDGRQALAPYAHQWVPDYARELATGAGLSRDTAPLVIEAAILAAARRAKAVGFLADQSSLPPPPQVGAGLVNEVAILRPVARYYRGSPIVRAVVEQMDRRYSGSRACPLS